MKSIPGNHCRLLISVIILLATTAVYADIPQKKEFVNSVGMKFVRIEPGSFNMGFEGKPITGNLMETSTEGLKIKDRPYMRNGNYDEHPAHKVNITKPFYMGIVEVTNAQYEQFDKKHQLLRGKFRFSIDDDEAAVFVDWHDAKAFCDWLSEKENLPYRLPTEAEWEYACRAGTNTYYWTGDTIPDSFCKNPRESSYPCTTRSVPEDIVTLRVGQTKPNPWGLFDMHGNVEEWCEDWYGPYTRDEQTDPVGCIDSDFKITRGGSHSTPPLYLRSANRQATIPDDKSWMLGFRVVIGQMPKTKPSPKPHPQLFQQNVKQSIPKDITKGPDPDKPYFKGPRIYIKIDKGAIGPLFYLHNHCPTIVNCPNGDLMAIWFTTSTESGRELVVAASRLRYDNDQWDDASLFWAPPDRNVATSTLWIDADGVFWNFNALTTACAAPAITLRKSTNNGATWSKSRTIVEHGNRTQVMETVFRASDSSIVLPADACRDGRTSVFLSKDNGLTWADPGSYKPGHHIAGIHAPIVELPDKSWLAFGRYDPIDGKMPKSISTDMGKTWRYSASEFPPISGGEKATMARLKEGPLFFASFTGKKGMEIKDQSGNTRKVKGLFAALSYDDGKTWPIKRLVTDDGPGREVFTRKSKYFTMSYSNAEGNGYLSSCQNPNGVINLIGNRVHYAFNLKWLETLPPAEPVAYKTQRGR
ncbi:MAG: SUMF1/EgtB/PvdO family nonheme iron enzyme [Planctomycetota bacterium]|jgi:formylglycine-generating enzyme required for sulfatase activity